MQLGPFVIFKEKANVVSPKPSWVFIDLDGYIYIESTFLQLLKTVVFEWHHDRHLVGYC
jgi:hypothetical protein